MSKGFPMVSLGEVLNLYQEYINEPEPRSYPKLSVKLYGKGVVLDTPADGSSLKMQRHQIAKSGQVILSEIWGKKGAIGIVPREGEGALCTSHFFLFDICQAKIEPNYLQAIFTANYLQEQLDSEAKGTTGYAAVRPKHLLSAMIPLPLLEEQRRIVARIDELAANIDEARGLHKEAVEETKFLFHQANNTIWVKSINEAKRLSLLEQVADVIDPQPDHRAPEEVIDGMPYISIANIDLNGVVDTYNARKVAPFAIERQEQAFALQTGDIILGKIGTVGAARPIIVKERLALSANVVLVKPHRDKVIDKFLLILLRATQAEEQFTGGTSITAQGAFGIKKMRKLVLPIPSIAIQQNLLFYFNRLQYQLDALKYHQTETSAELDALLPSILDKAFKGEL